MRKVTVFDFDGTLTKEDTFVSFARHCLGRGRLMIGLFRSFLMLLRWRLGMIPGGQAKERLFSALYKGRNKGELQKVAKDFIPNFREEVVEKLWEHKAAGDKVYIISASPDIWMEEMGDRLGVEVICTQTECDREGRLTGRFSTPNCHGVEKLRRLLEKEGDRKDFYLTVYGDELTGGDSALFKSADQAIVIND